MLLRYKVKNYKSIADELVVDLTAGSIKEHCDSLITVNKINILPLAAFFGANASGKSNLLQSLFAMRYEVISGNGLFSTFYYDSNKRDDVIEIEVCLYIESLNKEIRFGFTRLEKDIMEEWMFAKTFSNTPNLNETCVYYRKKGEKLISDLKDNVELKELGFVASVSGDNELILTNIGKRNISKYSAVFMWFRYNLLPLDYSGVYSSIAIDDQELLELLYKKELPLLEIEKFIKVVDSDIKGLEIREELDSNMNKRYKVYSKHLTKDNIEMEVPFSTESCGTKKVFSLALFVNSALKGGKVLVCDELDCKLHPLLLRYFVRMFADKKINVGNGQLIFTSHNLVCLDSSDLRRDEIWFVEKNNQKTSVFSLYDFKEESIRKDLSFGKHYLNGRFGAIPFN